MTWRSLGWRIELLYYPFKLLQIRDPSWSMFFCSTERGGLLKWTFYRVTTITAHLHCLLPKLLYIFEAFNYICSKGTHSETFETGQNCEKSCHNSPNFCEKLWLNRPKLWKIRPKSVKNLDHKLGQNCKKNHGKTGQNCEKFRPKFFWLFNIYTILLLLQSFQLSWPPYIFQRKIMAIYNFEMPFFLQKKTGLKDIVHEKPICTCQSWLTYHQRAPFFPLQRHRAKCDLDSWIDDTRVEIELVIRSLCALASPIFFSAIFPLSLLMISKSFKTLCPILKPGLQKGQS